MSEEAGSDLHYGPDDLKRFARSVLEREGLSEEDADIVAGALVEAELSGVGPHGMPHLILNVDKLRRGEAVARPEIRIRQLGTAIHRVDGGRCLGPIAARRAMGLAQQAAREHGIGFCLATNTHTYGSAAHFVRPVAEDGLVALSWANTASVMAPWGGIRPLLGTNPIAVGIPTGREPLIVLDMACSVRSWGDIVEARREGRAIPDGWALDGRGRPTNDPTAALEGALLPFGGYKGYGLALVVEILTGLLAGHGLSEPIPLAPGFTRTPLRTHCMLAIDVSRFVDVETFRGNVDALVAQIGRASAPGTGADAPRVPGAGAAERRRARCRRGIPLQPALIRQLQALAADTGVPWPDPKPAERTRGSG